MEIVKFSDVFRRNRGWGVKKLRVAGCGLKNKDVTGYRLKKPLRVGG